MTPITIDARMTAEQLEAAAMQAVAEFERDIREPEPPEPDVIILEK